VIIHGIKDTAELPLGHTIVASLLCLLSVLVKQNGVFLAIILLSFLAASRNWKMLAVASMATLIPLSLAGLYLKSSSGAIVAANVVDGVDNGVDLVYTLNKPFKEFFSGYSMVLALAALMSVTWLQRKALPLEKFFAICLIVNFAFATATAFKVGSSMAYYHNFIIVAAMSAAYFFERAGSPRESHGDVNLLNVTAAYLIWFLPAVSVFHLYDYGYSRTEVGSFVRPKAAFQFSALDDVVRFLRDKCAGDPEAKIISHELAINNLLPDRCLVPQKEIARFAYERETVDYSRLKALVDEGQVRYVVSRNVSSGQHPQEFLGISFDRFTKLRQFANHTVHEFSDERVFPSGQRYPDETTSSIEAIRTELRDSRR
jgi:hypothetical protein